MIKVERYQSINGLVFGVDDILKTKLIFGEPDEEYTNYLGALEYNYPKWTIRFDSQSGRFSEFTARGVSPEGLPHDPAGIDFEGQHLYWDKRMLIFLTQHEVWESFGFLISFYYGISLTGFHDDDESSKAIHFFQRGTWNEGKEKMNVYTL